MCSWTGSDSSFWIVPSAAAALDGCPLKVPAKKTGRPGVVENMSWFTGNDGERYELFGAGGGTQLAEKLNTRLLGQLPLAPALREGGDIGRPVLAAEPESEVAFQFEQLAREIEKIGPRRVYREELKVT